MLGGVLRSGGIGCGVRALHRSGWSAPVPLPIQRSCGFFGVPFCQERQPDIWLWRSNTGCLRIATFTFLCPENSSARSFSACTSALGLLMRYFISFLVAWEKPSLFMLAILHHGQMLECSRWTRPPSCAKVAEMLITYRRLVAASNSEIRLLPLPYTLQ